jgi:hypothetical protein
MKLTTTPEELYTRAFLAALNALVTREDEDLRHYDRVIGQALELAEMAVNAHDFEEEDDTYCVSCDGPCQYDPSEDEDEDCDCDSAVEYIVENASIAGLMIAATEILAKAGYELSVEVDDED